MLLGGINMSNNLVDLRDVLASVEAEHLKTQEAKITSFLEKIRNPYEFRVGSVTVRTSFGSGVTMDECFANYLAAI